MNTRILALFVLPLSTGLFAIACSADKAASSTGDIAQRDTESDAGDAGPATKPLTFGIDTAGSSIRLGSKTFPVGGGTLVGKLSPREPGNDAGLAQGCGFTVDAAATNPTLKSVRAISFPAINAQLELCGDINGRVADTAGGSARLVAHSASIKVKLSGAVNCEIPCLAVDLTSDGNGDGQDYTPGDGTAKLVSDQFTVPNSTCGSFVDAVLGLPSGVGHNNAVLSLQADLPAPTCQ